MNAFWTNLARRVLVLPRYRLSLPRTVRRLHFFYGLRLELVAELLDYRPNGQMKHTVCTSTVEDWLEGRVTPAEVETYGLTLSKILEIVDILSPAGRRLDGPDLEHELTWNQTDGRLTLLELIQQQRLDEAEQVAQQGARSQAESSPTAG